ncbi:unnamed protein product [Polarella glacialis]|uniref:Uncharacterized protein n=1 Tax=Polarella glacialis TaxID=89957 RepID=A0A813G2B3_POLGL|nr:unnamed protein product [Polarella glacialis]
MTNNQRSFSASSGHQGAEDKGYGGESFRVSSLTSQGLAAKERADIVVQLEEHLAQMRANLAESEREVRELEERRLAKEADLRGSSGAPSSTAPSRGGENEDSQELQHSTSAESAQTQLSLISQQIVEKKRFAAELVQKTKVLEAQVWQQRTVIVELLSGQRAPASLRARASSGGGGGSESSAEEGAVPQPSFRASLGASLPLPCQDEALRAFLDAAGDAAGLILRSPALRSAFEVRPPELCGSTLEGCSAEERVTVLSLFTAWVAVGSSPAGAMRLSDLSLTEEDTVEIVSTLETCNAELEEWEMMRCPASSISASASLLRSLGSQPLRRLSLGYNALGPTGASSLAAAAAASQSWASSLEHLSLEMNGLGDEGCREVAGLLEKGLLPGLVSLELGLRPLLNCCCC